MSTMFGTIKTINDKVRKYGLGTVDAIIFYDKKHTIVKILPCSSKSRLSGRFEACELCPGLLILEPKVYGKRCWGTGDYFTFEDIVVENHSRLLDELIESI